jgi:GAF domain-containing protein
MGLDVGDPRQSDEALIALAGILVAEQSLEKTLGQVLRLACGALPGANEGGTTAGDPRWPDFCQAAAAAGFGSTLSVPLIVNGDGLGAINLYCRHERGFSAADETAVVAFAAHAVVALANARIYWRAQRLASQLEEALATRGVIEQAKGILIAQYGCTADEAFGTLVSASQRGHQKLHDVARQLVEDTRQRR